MKAVAVGIGTTWSSDGGGGATIRNAASYLSALGISFSSGSDYRGYNMDATAVMESLSEGNIVIIKGTYEAGTRPGTRSLGGGSGIHCWLLDGFQQRTRPTTTRMISNPFDIYIHANFGWGGTEDGYYMADSDMTQLGFYTDNNGNFNTNLRIYPNVHSNQ